jgi:hypothetical protein
MQVSLNRSSLRLLLSSSSLTEPDLSVDPGLTRPNVTPHVHPDTAADREQNCDQLSNRQSAGKDPIVFRSKELDDEPLDPGQHTVKTEQPTLCVLVVADTATG